MNGVSVFTFMYKNPGVLLISKVDLLVVGDHNKAVVVVGNHLMAVYGNQGQVAAVVVGDRSGRADMEQVDDDDDDDGLGSDELPPLLSGWQLRVGGPRPLF